MCDAAGRSMFTEAQKAEFHSKQHNLTQKLYYGALTSFVIAYRSFPGQSISNSV
jgi:hypothetical protein